MTIQFSQFNGFSEKDYTIPQIFPPVVTPTPTPWVRPADWATMPTINSTDQKFAFLASVWNDPNNWYNFSVTTSTGNYQVDWGDGTSPVTYSSGTTATYTYDYATTPGSPTTRGYKTCVVTVTAVTGNLTGLNMNIAAATGTTGAKRWLDIVMGSPNLTSLTYLGTGTQNSIFTYLERIKLVSFNITNIAGLFANLSYLKNVELPSLTAVTSAANM